MGWKKVKEYYRIGHIVHVTKEGICIASPSIPDLMVIGMDGAIKFLHFFTYLPGGRDLNPDFHRYQTEMEADPQKLNALIAEPDRFEKSMTVYTYDDDEGEIVEKQCEEIGWPNVTHDGELMYEKTFSTDRRQVVRWAIRRARAGRNRYRDRVEEMTADLEDESEELEKWEGILTKLNQDLAASKGVPPRHERGNENVKELGT